MQKRHTFDGKNSTIQMNINGTQPEEAVKMTNDRLVTGTHSNANNS